MPISTLFERGLDAYVAEEGDDGQRFWIFVHIPKTAGSSFREELSRRLAPEYHLKVNYTSGQPLPAQRRAAIESCIASNRHNRFRFVSGHVQYVHMSRLAQSDPRARLITILRDPVSRVISDFHYQRSSEHPLAEQFKQRFPTLEDFVRFEAGQNKMVKFLRRGRTEGAADVVDRMMKEYAFVGLQDDYDLSFRLMTHLLGQSVAPKAHLRKGNGDTAVASETRDLITALNQDDVMVFEAFRRRFESVAKGVRAALPVAAEGTAPAIG